MNEDSCWVCKNKLSHGKFVANIFSLYEDGLKPFDIAQKLGISKQHVYEILNQNGHRQKSLKRSKAMKEMHASKKKVDQLQAVVENLSEMTLKHVVQDVPEE